jgi:hypothetical protein
VVKAGWLERDDSYISFVISDLLVNIVVAQDLID